jgi:hypothetical protein
MNSKRKVGTDRGRDREKDKQIRRAMEGKYL